jgi:hypothetical protein
MRLLHINSSARVERSNSCTPTAYFVEQLGLRLPKAEVDYPESRQVLCRTSPTSSRRPCIRPQPIGQNPCARRSGFRAPLATGCSGLTPWLGLVVRTCLS